MRVLIDRLGLQSRVHLDDNTRLRDLLSELQAAGHQVQFTQDRLTETELNTARVLIIPTRSEAHPRNGRTSIQGAAYSARELETLWSFVQRGGGLLLLTNHADIPGTDVPDHTGQDARLASLFGVTIERTCFSAPSGGPTTIAGEDLLMPDHPLLSEVHALAVNNSASLRATSGVGVAAVPATMVDRHGGAAPTGRLFVHAVDGQVDPESRLAGRVVTVGNSGILANEGSRLLNRGLFGHVDNRAFLLNAVVWAGSA